ncbi:MAG: MerR family DNA-binding protein [Actinobacteria bacterium]|nr:MerR family DNA-binding protein [Actinomycetota bacterium]
MASIETLTPQIAAPPGRGQHRIEEPVEQRRIDRSILRGEGRDPGSPHPGTLDEVHHLPQDNAGDTWGGAPRRGFHPPSLPDPDSHRQPARRIHFIKGAQGLGLKLAEIRELLEIQDRGACPCGHTMALVERHLDEIDAEMNRLSDLRVELAAMAALECPASDKSPFWACEVQFIKKGGER